MKTSCHMVIEVPWVTQDFPENEEPVVIEVQKVEQGCRVFLDKTVPLVCKGLRVFPGNQELQDFPDYQGEVIPSLRCATFVQLCYGINLQN